VLVDDDEVQSGCHARNSVTTEGNAWSVDIIRAAHNQGG